MPVGQDFLDLLDEEERPGVGSDFLQLLEGAPDKIIQDSPTISPEVLEAAPEEPSGFFGKAKELVTGEFRTTPEIEGLPGIGELPELNELSFASLKSAFNTVLSDPSEAAQALQANFPDLQVRQDEKGNFIVKSGVSGEDHILNPPGLDTRDIIRGGLQAALFAGPGKLATLPAKMLASAGVQGALETGQALTGGEFDAGQIPLAGATEAIAPGLGAAARGARGVAGAARRLPGVRQLTRGIKEVPLSPLEQSVKGAEDLGVDVLTSDVFPPKSRIKKLGQKIIEDIPITGTSGKRVVQQAQRKQALADLIDNFGATHIDDTIEEKVVDDFIKKRGEMVNKFSTMKKDVISKHSDKGIVPVEKATNFLDEEIERFRSLGTKDDLAAVKVFEDYKNAIQDQGLTNIEALRGRLGKFFKTDALAGVRDDGEKVGRKVYGILNEEMGDFIKTHGESRDFIKWKIANKRLSEGLDELGISTIKNVLKKGDIEPESVSRILLGSKPSSMKVLFKGLNPEGKRNAKALIFQDMVKKSGGDNISSERFLNQVKKNRSQLNIFLNKEDKKVLEGLVKTLELTKRAPEALASPTTGQQVTPFITPSLVGSAALLSDPSLTGVFKGVLATSTLGGLGRLFESKGVRNLLLQIAKAPKGKEQELLKKLTPLLQAARQQAGE